MSTAPASDVVRGLGVLTTFWKKVENAIREAGGVDEHIARLGKDSSDPAIKQFAETIVRGHAGGVSSFADQIRIGRYDYLEGFWAKNPDEIRGQTFHPVTDEMELDHPAVPLSTKQPLDRYANRMADLSEFLDYGYRHPNVQRQFPIAILWKDDIGQVYAAVLRQGRELRITTAHLLSEWSSECRFLVRRNLEARSFADQGS